MSKRKSRPNSPNKTASTPKKEGRELIPPSEQVSPLPQTSPKGQPARSRTGPRSRLIGRSSWKGVLAVIGVMVVLTVGIFWLVYFLTSPSASNPAGNQPRGQLGGVTCKEIPKFVQDLHFSNAIFFSTSERGYKGLTMLESGPPGRIYQHPTWTEAGYLAPIEFGSKGNIYVAPAPWINTLHNPPEQQNTVYRIDPQTGVMALFVALPRAAPPTEENPFGVLGLGYDCETNSLYASSVAGSTRNQETGHLYRVDATRGTVEAQIANLDPFGLGVYRGVKGKRLYYALARWPEIWSVALDEKGNFQGQPRKEISLANLGPRGSDKGRDIKFEIENQMEIDGIEFSFNLIAPTEKQETKYYFRYNQDSDSWTQINAST